MEDFRLKLHDLYIKSHGETPKKCLAWFSSGNKYTYEHWTWIPNSGEILIVNDERERFCENCWKYLLKHHNEKELNWFPAWPVFPREKGVYRYLTQLSFHETSGSIWGGKYFSNEESNAISEFEDTIYKNSKCIQFFQGPRVVFLTEEMKKAFDILWNKGSASPVNYHPVKDYERVKLFSEWKARQVEHLRREKRIARWEKLQDERERYLESPDYKRRMETREKRIQQAAAINRRYIARETSRSGFKKAFSLLHAANQIRESIYEKQTN